MNWLPAPVPVTVSIENLGALADLGKIIAGEAGTTVSPKESGIVYAA